MTQFLIFIRGHNSVNYYQNLTINNLIIHIPNINAHTKFRQNPRNETEVIIVKQYTDIYVHTTDRHTDFQHKNLICTNRRQGIIKKIYTHINSEIQFILYINVSFFIYFFFLFFFSVLIFCVLSAFQSGLHNIDMLTSVTSFFFLFVCFLLFKSMLFFMKIHDK